MGFVGAAILCNESLANPQYCDWVLRAVLRPSPLNDHFWYVGPLSESFADDPNMVYIEPFTDIYPVQKSDSEVLLSPIYTALPHRLRLGLMASYV